MSRFRLFLVLAIVGVMQTGRAGDSISTPSIKFKTRLLLGQWQLSKTFSRGTYRNVVKSDYDDIIVFKPHHHFIEEVFYESNHWIIEGNWNTDIKHNAVLLAHRKYTVGKLEDNPLDIILILIQLNSKSWAGKATVKGDPVEMYYTRISKH